MAVEGENNAKKDTYDGDRFRRDVLVARMKGADEERAVRLAVAAWESRNFGNRGIELPQPRTS